MDIATAGVCANDEKHHVFGVSVAPSAGVSLNAEITRASDKGNPLAKFTIAVSTHARDIGKNANN